jgi:DNA replication protein DnaC
MPDQSERETADPNCPYCKGLGYVRVDVPVGHPDFGSLALCQCRAEALERERLRRLENVSGLGPALRRKTFEGFVVVHRGSRNGKRPISNRRALQEARVYAEDPCGWLVIAGGNGAGKTHLAAAIANYRLGQRKPALFVVAPDLLDHLRASYAPDSSVSYDERFQQICETPLLILDDLGAQQCTEWAWEKLYQILTRRRNQELPLVVTTNLDVSDSRALNRRVSSRLSERGWVTRVLITAPDWRRRPLKRIVEGG